MKELKLRHFDGKYMQYSRDFESLYDYINHFKEFDKEELLFTGLKDNNRRDIYEGDIVRFKYGFDGEEFLYNEIKFGKSVDNRYGFFIDSHLCLSSVVEFGKSEVIGNIYENKELLNP